MAGHYGLFCISLSALHLDDDELHRDATQRMIMDVQDECRAVLQRQTVLLLLDDLDVLANQPQVASRLVSLLDDLRTVAAAQQFQVGSGAYGDLRRL